MTPTIRSSRALYRAPGARQRARRPALFAPSYLHAGLVIQTFDPISMCTPPSRLAECAVTSTKGPGMFRSQQYRAKAAEYGELVKSSGGSDESRSFRKLQERLVSLAENEQRLADNYHDALQVVEQDRSRGAALAAEEEHVLRCLGAAIIMQWNSLPTTLQREIFDTAGSVGKFIGDSGAPWSDRPISAQAQE